MTLRVRLGRQTSTGPVFFDEPPVVAELLDARWVQWPSDGNSADYHLPEQQPGQIQVVVSWGEYVLLFPDLDTTHPGQAHYLVPEVSGAIAQLRGVTDDAKWDAVVQAAEIKTGRARYEPVWSAIIYFQVGDRPPTEQGMFPMTAELSSDDLEQAGPAAFRDAYAAFTRLAAIARMAKALWGLEPDSGLLAGVEDDVTKAAFVYQEAERRGLPPRHWVQQALGGSPSRAARHIAAARDRGLLPAVTDGRARQSRGGKK